MKLAYKIKKNKKVLASVVAIILALVLVISIATPFIASFYQ